MGSKAKRRKARQAAAATPDAARRGCLWIAAVVTLGGCLLTVVMLRHVIVPAVRANQAYVETTGRLLDKRVRMSRQGAEYTVGHFVEGRRGTLSGAAEFRIEYRVGDETYSPWVGDDAGAFSSEREEREFFDSLRVGETYPCWYDPAEPHRAVLVRGYGVGFAFMVAIPLAFLGSGAYGLWSLRGRPTREAGRGPAEGSDVSAAP